MINLSSRRWWALGTLALGSSISIGCHHFQEWTRTGKVGPEYVQPQADLADHWIDYNSPAVISAANAVADDAWWRVFNDPALEQVVGDMYAQNLPLQIAYLRVREFEYQRAIAVGNLLPQQQQAFAEYGAYRNSSNGNAIGFPANTNGLGVPGIGGSFDLYQVGFNASWEIDLWGRLRRLVEASDANLHVTMEDEADLRLKMTADVVAVFTEIRVLQARLQIARDQVASQLETVRIADGRYSDGAGSRLDVVQAVAVADATEATIPMLQYQIREANNRLCLLLGVPTQVLFDEFNYGPIPSVPPSVFVGTPCDLLRRRPDIRRAEREVASQSAMIGVAAADLFPRFALRGTINWQAFEFNDLFRSDSNAGAIVPGFYWDILNYGRLKNRVHVQETRLEQAVLNYQQTVLNAGSEVETALAAYLRKQEQIESYRKSEASTAEALDIAIGQFKEGAVDLDRVNNLRKDLIRQMDLRVTTEGEAAIALIRLYKAMGGGWNLCDSPPQGVPYHEMTMIPPSSLSEPQPFAAPAVPTWQDPAAQPLQFFPSGPMTGWSPAPTLPSTPPAFPTIWDSPAEATSPQQQTMLPFTAQ